MGRFLASTVGSRNFEAAHTLGRVQQSGNGGSGLFTKQVAMDSLGSRVKRYGDSVRDSAAKRPLPHGGQKRLTHGKEASGVAQWPTDIFLQVIAPPTLTTHEIMHNNRLQGSPVASIPVSKLMAGEKTT